MGLATKLKGVLSDYKYRRNSSSTAQASIYHDTDASHTPGSYPTNEFPRTSNASNNNSNHESWFGLRGPDRSSEELSPRTSKFSRNRKDNTSEVPNAPGLGLGQHRPDQKDEDEDNETRIRGLRKPNYAADPLYHQRHYKHYRQQQKLQQPPLPPPPPPSKKDRKKKKKNEKEATGRDTAATEQQMDMTVDGVRFPIGGPLHSRHASKPSSSSQDERARPQHTHRHQPSSSSSLFFPEYSNNPSSRPSERGTRRGTVSTTATTATTASSSRFDDDDDDYPCDDVPSQRRKKNQARLKHSNPPPFYTCSLSPEPRGRVLRETIPSSAVFGSAPGQLPWCANTTNIPTPTPTPTPIAAGTAGTPDRQSIIVGIDSSGVLRDMPGSATDDLPIQRPPTPTPTPIKGRGHVPADGAGSPSAFAAPDRVPEIDINNHNKVGGSDSGSGRSRVSTGAVGGAGVIAEAETGARRIGGGGVDGAHGRGRGGLRVVHRCEGCGADNDISRYFGTEAVYRML